MEKPTLRQLVPPVLPDRRPPDTHTTSKGVTVRRRKPFVLGVDDGWLIAEHLERTCVARPSAHRPRDRLLHVASRRVASGQEWNKVPPGGMVRPRDHAKGTQGVKGAGGGEETVYEGMKDED
ncbi:hypothetical protein ALC56_00538 [Trachymyrmex septentrionalis]|uniref:Uncharacterized protein n=1 Tax=Trachymyrmex septentrionalis TaxID=34720 RepID=A0A195FZ15_9HYME|nr:hypothetical protein ALC56_00538 [Trachymyrmex septentrionalis]